MKPSQPVRKHSDELLLELLEKAAVEDLTPIQQEILKEGYTELHTEILFWIGLREGIPAFTWSSLVGLIFAIVAQSIASAPVLSIVGYGFPVFVRFQIMKWNRYNRKIDQKAQIRRDIEAYFMVLGVELREKGLPPTGVDNEARQELATICAITISVATASWMFQYRQYPVEILIGLIVAMIATIFFSWTSISSLWHERARDTAI